MDDSTAREIALLHGLRETPELFAALREAEGKELSVQKQLRARFPEELVPAALRLLDLRRRAAEKFERAEEMWFDRTGLEQATAEAVARHKAKRFSGDVWDFCCGIGGDAIALAARGAVTAVDRSPLRCLQTEWNCEAYGVADRVEVVCRDVTRIASRDGLLHVDPDRRAGARGRSLRVQDLVPDVETLRRWTEEFRGGAIKLSPASNFPDVFPETEAELISLRGECKEATIWFGELRGEHSWRATVLPGGETLTGEPLDYLTNVGPLGAYLYDPDPAVVRAGLVDMLAETSSLTRLDAAEEYLTSEEYVQTPFAQAFEVLAVTPNNDTRIRRAVREQGLGQVEIKCRRIPIDAEAIRRKLPLEGEQAGVLVYARVEGRTRAVLCRRVAAGQPEG